MYFLRRYLASFLGYLSNRFWGSNSSVDAGEEISRFLFQSGHFSSTKKTAKYAAFMPPKGMHEISVYRTSGFSRNTERLVAYLFVEPFAQRQTKACAKFQASEAALLKLGIKPDGKPDRWHANIVGWENDKSIRMVKAKALAKASRVTCY